MLLNSDLAQIPKDCVPGFVTHEGKALKVETERGQRKMMLFFLVLLFLLFLLLFFIFYFYYFF